MKRDLVKLPRLDSSFLSCEKDTETILRRLFVESQPYSDQLKRLLVINTKDCLDNLTDEQYLAKIKSMSVANLRRDGYIMLEPKIKMAEHEDVKSYMVLTFDNFTPNKENPKYRDCLVNIDVFCHTDYWDIGDYRLRPLKIIGIIDGLLNNSKLSGIGTLEFGGCDGIVFDEVLSGYSLRFRAVHMTDDMLPGEE